MMDSRKLVYCCFVKTYITCGRPGILGKVKMYQQKAKIQFRFADVSRLVRIESQTENAHSASF
jgi:hypothetical protein